MVKSFFKFLKFSIICMTTRFCNVFFGSQIKVVVFAAIFVPCFLQFPLVSFGQDGVDIGNSSLGIVEVDRKHVEFRENKFESTGTGTEEIFFISSDGKNVVGLLGEPSNKNTSDNGKDESVEPSFFHRQFVDPFHYEPMESILYWIMMMFPIIVAIIYPIIFGSRDNARVTGRRGGTDCAKAKRFVRPIYS